MLLNLTDILTMQQVERPRPIDSHKNSPAVGSSFKDVLDKPQYTKESDNRPDPTKAIKTSTDSFITHGKVIPADSGATKIDSNILGNIGSDNVVNNNLKSGEDSQNVNQTKVTLSDLTNVLNANQKGAAGLSDEQLKAANAILAKLGDEAIPENIPADQLVAQVVGQIKSAGLDETSSIDDILQQLSLANFAKQPGQTLEELATQALAAKHIAGSEINKPASKVIEVAKDEAGKPVISASDLKSLQIESLSSLGKKKNKDSDGQENLSLDSPIDFIPAAVVENAAIVTQDKGANSVENLQETLARSNGLIMAQKAGNEAVQDDMSQQNSTNSALVNQSQLTSQTNTPQIANPAFTNLVSHVIAQADSAKDNLPALPVKDNVSNTGPMSTENFLKFQNMLDGAQETRASTNNSSLKNTAEIMAQIKFGFAGKGKDESNISIQLHPKELGKVDITMQMASDGKTHVTVIAENTDTLNLLQKESGALRGMLTDALKTDSSNLNFSFQQGGSDNWARQFSNGIYSQGRNTDSADSIIGNNYLPAQNYRYNMIVTDGLDIRV